MASQQKSPSFVIRPKKKICWFPVPLPTLSLGREPTKFLFIFEKKKKKSPRPNIDNVKNNAPIMRYVLASET